MRGELAHPIVMLSTLSTFVLRKDGRSIFSGLHYEALSGLLDKLSHPARPQPDDQPTDFNFAVLHELPTLTGAKRLIKSLSTLGEMEESLRITQGNKILFLRGYPMTEWLSRIGSSLGVDYEFFFQHLANPTQLNLSDMFCLPPISVIRTGTIQLTFTSIGTWDNHKSGTSLDAAHTMLAKDMKIYTDDMNKGRGIKPCDSIVRTFSLYDLKHFAIEQQVTIKLLQLQGYWIVIVWSDCGNSLGQSHHGPWKRIRDTHAGEVRFLSWPLNSTNREMRHIIKCTQEESDEAAEKVTDIPLDPLAQRLSLLCQELGQNEDSTEATASSTSPFHALNTIFQLLAVSEYQFLNLMEEKTKTFGQSARQGIGAIQNVKKQVDVHLERLEDVIDIIKAQGGRGWSLISQQPSSNASRHSDEHGETQIQRRETSLSTNYQPHHQRDDPGQSKSKKRSAVARAEDAAFCLERTFQKLIRRAQAVSSGCQDEMERLSNESVVREAQRGKEQAEAVAKVTFIAAVFVPLSFTTSIFGMDLQQLNGSGSDIRTWIYVVVPVMLVSVVAWAFNGERVDKVWQYMKSWLESQDISVDQEQERKESV
ncbi:hypothetical protein FHETE_10952 [Fusarium heterosporum]|uniref:Uncharacterized protein n=1 Tax=Fusarium heterosporum TaxID=42747 RepID=A0A8H5WBP4_FUSHE|nr:hypothetical protein FHETE_10952 [Fusarium heterosporum]